MNWLLKTYFKTLKEMPCSCGKTDCKAYAFYGLLYVRFFKIFEIGISMLVDSRSRDEVLVSIGKRLGYVEFASHAVIMLAIAFAIAGVL